MYSHNGTIVAFKLTTRLSLQCDAVQDTTPVVQSGAPKSITVEVTIMATTWADMM